MISIDTIDRSAGITSPPPLAPNPSPPPDPPPPTPPLPPPTPNPHTPPDDVEIVLLKPGVGPEAALSVIL